ncbi:MAG: ATP-binding cassette domain-containing protein, partial [Deltaproteobacteria bacterium]|nr:ATP-binding cassette domain-containing protein [Deltaproteobacteria bacterium]
MLGTSGGGKSTVAGLLLRLCDPLEGRVSLDGVDIRELDTSWLREQIGIVSQEPVLFAPHSSGSDPEHVHFPEWRSPEHLLGHLEIAEDLAANLGDLVRQALPLPVAAWAHQHRLHRAEVFHGHLCGEVGDRPLGEGVDDLLPRGQRCAAHPVLPQVSDHQRQHHHEAQGANARGRLEEHRGHRGGPLQPPEAGVALDDALVAILGEGAGVVPPRGVQVVGHQREAGCLAALGGDRVWAELHGRADDPDRLRRRLRALPGAPARRARQPPDLRPRVKIDAVEAELRECLARRAQRVLLARRRLVVRPLDARRDAGPLSLQPPVELGVEGGREGVGVDDEEPHPLHARHGLARPGVLVRGGLVEEHGEGSLDAPATVVHVRVRLAPVGMGTEQRPLLHVRLDAPRVRDQLRTQLVGVGQQRDEVETGTQELADGLPVHELAVRHDGDLVLGGQQRGQPGQVVPVGPGIGGVAVERRAHERHSGVPVDRQAEHELLQVGAVVLGVPERRDGAPRGRLGVLPVERERREVLVDGVGRLPPRALEVPLHDRGQQAVRADRVDVSPRRGHLPACRPACEGGAGGQVEVHPAQPRAETSHRRRVAGVRGAPLPVRGA